MFGLEKVVVKIERLNFLQQAIPNKIGQLSFFTLGKRFFNFCWYLCLIILTLDTKSDFHRCQ